VNPLYDRYLQRADGLIFWGGCEQEYDSQRTLSQPHITLDPAVDTELFRPQSPPDCISVGTDNTITVGFVGRLEPVKRIDRIIDAVASLRDAYPVKLFVVGGGSRRDELEAAAAQKLPTESFDFSGRVKQDAVPQYLNAIDIFVMSSRLENHPIALKEAVACGTYCVAPDIGRVSEILEKGAGKTYSPPGVSTLTEILAEIIEDGAFRAGTRAERAHEFNTWHDNARAVAGFHLSLDT
jgi:glycosyltransferase involved in cell wall biosynthesis